MTITLLLQGTMSIGKQEIEVVLEQVMLTSTDLQHNPRNCIEVGPLYYQSDLLLVQSTVHTGLENCSHRFRKTKNQISIFWQYILRYTSESFYMLLLTYSTTTGIAWKLVHYIPKVVHYLYCQQYMLVWRTIRTDFGKQKTRFTFQLKIGVIQWF